MTGGQRGARVRTWVRGCLWLVLGLLAARVPAHAAEGRARTSVVIGFSSRVLGEANRMDLTAAMKAWMQTITRERHLDVEAHIEVFDSVAEMERALREEEIDVVSLPADDFLALEKLYPLAGLFANQVKQKATDQFVLLARRDRVRQGLASLRGESLVVLDEPRSLLAPLWLDTELLRRHLPVSARHFGRLTSAAKASRVILPVFFRQADAALMTRSGFETACELNPQLGKELVVLASSPELVSSVGAYRANSTSAAVALYRNEALKLGETPAGKLILTLFRTEAIVDLKPSELRETRALLAEHARLLAGQGRDGER